jgi:hypothetical protein
MFRRRDVSIFTIPSEPLTTLTQTICAVEVVRLIDFLFLPDANPVHPDFPSPDPFSFPHPLSGSLPPQ